MSNAPQRTTLTDAELIPRFNVSESALFREYEECGFYDLASIKLHDKIFNINFNKIADWIVPIMRRIFEFYSLEDNWDGEDGKALDRKVIGWIAEFCNRYSEEDTMTPGVYLTPEGGIQFEWHSIDMDNNKKILRIEISIHKTINVEYVSGEVYEYIENCNDSMHIREIVNKFKKEK